jgi:hypothetical protein
MSDERTPLEDKSQQLLRESAENLDGRTRSRLTQARHAALAELESGKSQKIRWMLPAGAAAAGVLAVAMLSNRAPVTQPDAVAVVEDIEIMTAGDSLEMYENLEFYAWLDEVSDEELADENGTPGVG